MKTYLTRLRVSAILTLVAMMSIFGQAPSRGDTYDVTTTNQVDTWVTNLIEVRIPRNHFINQYRTNWVEKYGTNIIGRYITNWQTVTLTNFVPVQAVHTNHSTAYVTNLTIVSVTNDIPVQAFHTNFVDAYHTNLKTLLLTKDVFVDATLTNFADHYRTNWKTLTFTNWQSVLVMRTNWITQPVTNLVQIDLPVPTAPVAAAPAPKAVIETKNIPVAAPAPSREATGSEAVVLEAIRTGRLSKENQVEVQLQARWKTSNDPLQVQQWRVQREDGAILCLGQEQQFRRELPVGKYRVEVRLQRDSAGPVLVARGDLELMTTDAVMHQTFAVAK
jgi:hypothetical protein